MVTFLIIGICIGSVIMVTISSIISDYPEFKINNLVSEKYPKICKNCNNFIPYADTDSKLKGICQRCCSGSYLFNLNMSCGHFEYTKAIQSQIDKKHLERCFKK